MSRARIKVSDAEHASAQRGLVAHERTLRAARRAPDFDVTSERMSSVVLISPLSERCKAWIDEHVESEGWQWLGGSLAVEYRLAHDLIDGLVSAGFRGRS